MNRTKTTISIVFLLTSLFWVHSIAPTTACYTCQKEITGKYITAHNKYFHPRHFVCDKCSEIMKDDGYYYENGKFYDKDCFEELKALPCEYCKKNIIEKFVIYNGKNYHKDCFNEHIALRCSLCQEVINGDYLLDYRGNKYCQKHRSIEYQCEYCLTFFGAESNQGGYRYHDGRTICTACKDTSPADLDDLSELAEEINNLLKKYNLDLPLDTINFQLVNKDELADISGVDGGDLLGYTMFRETSSFFGLFKEQKYNVYILDGMPRIYTIQALAHELNHVWQFMQSSETKTRPFCEGSANYTVYLILNNYNSKMAEKLIDNMMNQQDPDYGEGFRRIKNLVDQNSIEYWLDHLANNIDFPENY